MMHLNIVRWTHIRGHIHTYQLFMTLLLYLCVFNRFTQLLTYTIGNLTSKSTIQLNRMKLETTHIDKRLDHPNVDGHKKLLKSLCLHWIAHSIANFSLAILQVFCPFAGFIFNLIRWDFEWIEFAVGGSGGFTGGFFLWLQLKLRGKNRNKLQK